MYFTVSRSLFPTIKKDEAVRDDLPLPNSTKSDTLTVRNQSKCASTTGKQKGMNILFVACFFSWSRTSFSYSEWKSLQVNLVPY